MPAGVLAGPYNKTVAGGVWTDPTDPTMSSAQSINPIIANKPLTISVWFKPNTFIGQSYNPVNPGFYGVYLFVLERMMMDPAHNSQNGFQGIRIRFDTAGWNGYRPSLIADFEGNGSQNYMLTTSASSFPAGGGWLYDKDIWMNVIVAYEPGSTGTDRTKNYIYVNGDNTAITPVRGNAPNIGAWQTGTFASGTVVNSIGQNGDYYNVVPGRRTFLGAGGDTGSTTGVPSGTISNNRVMQMKEFVIWDRILTSSEVQSVWNSGTSLGDKDNYPNTPKIGWMFPNDGFTYNPDHYNSQQDEYGQIRLPNVYNSSYGTLTSNYGRVVNNAANMKQYWFPSHLVNSPGVARSI